VYAFEPDPRNLAALRLNARAAGNIEVIDAAVSSSTGVTPLHLGVGSATTSLRPQANRPVIQVPTTSIDAFWSGHPSIDPALIKTDIEGHDLEALRGMTQVVARSQPLILTECDQPSDLGSLCRDWGYAIFAYTRSDPFAAASFRQMRAADFSLQFKMLFLVPARLSPHFMALTVGG
jgi:FkbM family methyltransferase